MSDGQGKTKVSMNMPTMIAGAAVFFLFGLALARRWRTGPAAAVLGAAGFLGAFVLYDAWPQAVVLGLVTAISWVLIEVDRRSLILPDRLVVPLILLALAAAWLAPLYPDQSLDGALAGAAFAAGLLSAVRWAYGRWRGREGLGLGDVKLAAAGGALDGIPGVAPMILLAALATLLAALVLKTAGGAPLADRKLPLGPGLCLGMLLVVIGRHAGLSP